MRRITTTSRRYSRQMIDALASCLTIEMLDPSDELYLASAWITDLPLLDNCFGQLRVLSSETVGTHIPLSYVLCALAERGQKIFIATRENAENQDFMRRVQAQEGITLKTSNDLHLKILVSQHFCWEGSMNFTYSGVHRNPETITLSTDKEHISRALIHVRQLWETLS